MPSRIHRRAYTLMELTAVLGVLGLVGAIVISRMFDTTSSADREACNVIQGDIEMEVFLWRREHGRLPAADLSDIATDPSYFIDGLPKCPVDGSQYSIDSRGNVVGHDH